MSYNNTADYFESLTEETKRRIEESTKKSAQEYLWRKNSQIEQHRNKYSLKYKISVNNTTYNCRGFDLVLLNLPVATALNKASRMWNGFALAVDIIAGLSGSEIFLPPSENEKFNISQISIMRLIGDDDEPFLDIVSNDERDIIVDSVKHCQKECEEMYGSIGMKILNSICDKNNKKTAFIDSLVKISDQFRVQQEEQQLQINKKRAETRDKIVYDFYASNLLAQDRLSNLEKMREYSYLRTFCCKYIPDLNERNFRIESLHTDYPDYLSKETVESFKENWIRLSRSYSRLSRGVNGEKKVYEVLRLFDDRVRILRDYVCAHELGFHEHDFIIITPYGISTIEVKNLRGDYVLTETGVLKCLSSNKVEPKDVALQSKKHLETLRRNLNGCSAFSANMPLQEIICSAESNFTIRDDYHYIPVCYYNTVDKVLFPENAKPILNEKAMEAIEKYLLENRREAFEFDVFLPRGEIDSRADFIRCFADVASGVLVSHELQ